PNNPRTVITASPILKNLRAEYFQSPLIAIAQASARLTHSVLQSGSPHPVRRALPRLFLQSVAQPWPNQRRKTNNNGLFCLALRMTPPKSRTHYNVQLDPAHFLFLGLAYFLP